MRAPESFVGQPIRSLQTMLRLIAENDPSHPNLIPDGIYGPDTVKAVTYFQRNHGLPPTGVTDLDTWEAIVAQYTLARIFLQEAQPVYPILNPGQVLRKGERHPLLWVAQAMLAVLAEIYGSIPGPGLTGILDEATAQALASFQQLSILPMTGHLDKRTWKHLALHYPLAASISER